MKQTGISKTKIIIGCVAALVLVGAWWFVLEVPIREIRERSVDGPPPQSGITAETPRVYCLDRRISRGLVTVRVRCSRLSIIAYVRNASARKADAQKPTGPDVISVSPVVFDVNVLSQSGSLSGVTHLSHREISVSFDPQEPAYLEVDDIEQATGHFHTGGVSFGDVYKPDETIWTALDIAAQTYESDVDPLPPPSSDFRPVEISAPVALEPENAAIHYRFRMEGISPDIQLPNDPGGTRFDALGKGNVDINVIAAPFDAWLWDGPRRAMGPDHPIYVRRIGVTYTSGFSLGVAGRAHANQEGLIEGDLALKVASIGVLGTVHPAMALFAGPLEALDKVFGKTGLTVNVAARNGEVTVNGQDGPLALLGNESTFKIPAIP